MIDLAAITTALAELCDLARRGVEALERMEGAPLRGVGPEDLLTEEEVGRYIRLRRIDVRAWLVSQRVPRAVSPGAGRIPLYRACDVRRALEQGVVKCADGDFWKATPAASSRAKPKKKEPATPKDAGPVSTIVFPSHRAGG